MNKTEIERAIRFFEGWMKYWEGKSGLPKDYQRLMKAKDTAMTALRDALSRLEGCAACLDFAGMVRSDNYCFKCGRKLKEERQ